MNAFDLMLETLGSYVAPEPTKRAAPRKYNPFRPLVGERFGRLLVLEQTQSGREGVRWLCRCDCGATKTIPSSALLGGRTKSCGCWRKEYLGLIRHNRPRPPAAPTEESS